MSQVTITATDNQINVGVGELRYFGSFYSTVDQASLGANLANKMTYNTTAISNGVSIVSNSRITIANAGIYNIQFSAQLDKTDSGDDVVDIWLCKNTNLVDYSNTQTTLVGNNGKHVAAWNFFVNAAAGDFFEICWTSADASVFLNYVAAQTTPTRPAIPSVILTVNRVG
jgi:proline racemase